MRKKGLNSLTGLKFEVPNKTGNVRTNVILRRVRVTIVEVKKKGISITNSECISAATVIQQATCMRHIVICGLSGVRIFLTLYYKPQDFRKIVSEHKICALISSTTFV